MNSIKSFGLLSSVLKTNVNSVRTAYSRLLARNKPVKQIWPFQPRGWPQDNREERYGFTYYPRYPDQEDPHWEPTPLFMVKRVKRYAGTPWYYKRILRSLRIEQRSSEIAIVVNSPQNNSKLWKVKHLVEITPITFPDGWPTEEDIPNCHLFENGELRISKDLSPDSSRLEATETFQKKLDVLHRATIESYTRRKWLADIQNINEM